ncbi:hypothetical protein LSS_10133 [Leptospira santarosai serovar Shermani str. LT 821]|uniref:Uncharacterized protein n=1 Tax=Leptospira santarosai serovar Shermani str. LT 821 TaxID=758847 RepID=K8XZD3_9LEPT|nr:hypothetical protein LSS_10133 [Leptospira santarosai serovar Shermani str. LT 821]
MISCQTGTSYKNLILRSLFFGFYRGSHKGSTTKLFAENSNDKMAPSVVQTADLLLVIRTTTVPFVLKE